MINRIAIMLIMKMRTIVTVLAIIGEEWHGDFYMSVILID